MSRKDYDQFDLFRYVKFLEENPHLKNNLIAIKEYNRQHPKLTTEQKIDNLLKALKE